MAAQGKAPPSSSDGFALSPRTAWALYAVQLAISIAGGIFTVVASDAAALRLGVRWWPGWVTLLLMIYVAILVHEIGHAIGARAGGMVPVLLRVSPLAWRHTLSGWRVAWWPKGLMSGMTVALLDPERPFRGQMLPLVAGGPLANAACAVACLLVVPFVPPWLTMGLVAFAVLHATFAIANLVPTQVGCPSDGLLLWRWSRGLDEHAPQLAFNRLLALAHHGRMANELPVELVDALAVQPQPMPLLHVWYSMKVHQERMDWSAVAAMEPMLDAQLPLLTPAQLKGCGPIIAQARMEIRFSQAMGDLPLGTPPDPRARYLLDWSVPSLTPRCEALAAFESGDAAMGKQKLAQSQRHAEDTGDLGHRRSEALLRSAILAKFAAAP